MRSTAKLGFTDAVRVTMPDFPEPVVDINLPPGGDESAFLIMILTAVCRSSLWLAPGLAIRAPGVSGSGNGKGLLVRLLGIIAFGIEPSAMSAGTTAEETDKRIVAMLAGVEPMVCLDNVNGVTLRSDALASAITERPAYVRPLGSTTTVLLNSTALITVTGNGLGWSEDLARRLFETNLDAGVEDPESREFPGDFLDDARASRPELLGAALTIWRWARRQGGDLQSGRPLGSFGDWARWCRDPMLALGCVDPVVRMAKAKAADPERAFLAELFNTWWKRHEDKLTTAAKLHSDVKAALDPNDKGRQFQAHKLASLNGTRAAGYLLTRIPATGQWSAASYRLTTTRTPDEGTGIDVTGGIDPPVRRGMSPEVPKLSSPLSIEELDEAFS